MKKKTKQGRSFSAIFCQKSQKSVGMIDRKYN